MTTQVRTLLKTVYPRHHALRCSFRFFFNRNICVCLFFLIIIIIPEASERSEGLRRALGSLEEDDPNILLAIQLSLQESRRDPGLDGGPVRGTEGMVELERGVDRGHERSAQLGDPGDAALHARTTDVPAGARGTSFPMSLADPPRPPHRTDSTYQSPRSASLPPPPPTLSAELLELGGSLMKLGNTTTADAHAQEQRCSRHTHSHSSPAGPRGVEPAYSNSSHRQEANAQSSPHTLDHAAAGHPCFPSKEPAYCHATAYSDESDRDQNLARPPSSYMQERAAACDRTAKANSSYSHSQEHAGSNPPLRPAAYAPQRPFKSDLQPLAQLCLLSPELEPEHLLSPVIPRGGPFSPSDSQSLESLDPAASAQLLDNIMAWFNNNINPQNNPQSLALIPSPPTTESDSSPDTHAEAESKGQASGEVTPVPVWQPPEGGPGEDAGSSSPCPGAVGTEGTKTSRPGSLDLESRKAVEEGADGRCVADLSLDEAYAHLSHPHPHRGGSPAHTATAAERDLAPNPQAEGDPSPEEWEERVHLV